MRELTTSEVAVRLDVAQPTVKLWCRQKRFPNAYLETTPRGDVWRIPESDLEGFQKPALGRPPKPKAEKSAKRKASRE